MQCSKGDSCSFSHDGAPGNRCGLRQKGQSPSLAPKPQTQTDGKKPSGSKKKILQEQEAELRAKISLGESVRIRQCKFVAPSLVCKSQVWIRMQQMVKNVISDMLRQKERPAKEQRKVGQKGSVAILKESTQWCCVSQDSYPRKSILHEPGKLGSNHTVKFSKGTWHHIKNFGERKGPSRGKIQKCEPLERNPCASRINGKNTRRNLCNKKSAPAEYYGICRKSVYMFYSPTEAMAMRAPTSKIPKEREFVVDSGASWSINAHAEQKKDLSSDELETLRRFRNSTTVVTASGKVQTVEEAQVYVYDLDLFVTVPAVLSLGKALRRTRIFLRLGQRSKATSDRTKEEDSLLRRKI